MYPNDCHVLYAETAPDDDDTEVDVDAELYVGLAIDVADTPVSVTTLSQIMATTITSATSTIGQTLYCMVRTRLYDATTGTDVPGAVNTQVVYIHAGGVEYGSTSNVTSLTNSFASVGGSSSIIVGHTYRTV